MVTLNEYAQFSSIVYAKTDENKLPVPTDTGWLQLTWESDTLLGFSVGAYRKGDEIVIAYTGTNGELQGALDHLLANGPAGTGMFSSQVLAAINFYLQVRDDNPGATISFTGHSLGGGLAALMAVYFDKEATTFAPAPFKASAGNVATMGLYLAAITALGKSDPAFNDYIVDPSALYAAREAKVEAHTIEGEVLIDVFGRLGTIVDPAKDFLYAAGNSVSSIGLHSMLLHAAVIRSPDFRQAAATVEAALLAIKDNSLYASDAQFSPELDFMHQLMQQEWTWSGSASASPLSRFAADLLKLAPSIYGMASGTGIAAALVVVAIEYRYFKDAATATQLFTFDSYGLHFKYSDIGASSYKSLPKLAAAVNAFLMPEELALLNGKLLKQDAWHIQSGLGGMVVHAGADNDVMIGGTNSDGLWAGAGNDILIGGANNDVLVGDAGNDYLLGGIGFDTYILNAGDGYDTILDTDGLGVINLGSVLAKGSATDDLDPAKWIQRGSVWQDQEHGITYGLAVLTDGSQTLFITGLNGSTIEIKGWSAGELGIDLGAGTQPPAATAPVTSYTIAGDLKPLDTDPAADGVQEEYDTLDNLKVTDAADPDREDILYDSVGNDHLLGLGGNDTLYAWRGGDDLLEGGSGQDYLSGGTGHDTLVGGTGSDVLLGGANNDHLFGKDQITDLAAAILASEIQLGTGGRGDWLSAGDAADILVGDAGNDVLLGGEGEDLLIGGGGNDNIYGDQSGDANINWVLTRNVIVVDSSISYNSEITNGNTVEAAIGAADVIYGGAGDDWIQGGQGNDIIDAGADNDLVFGGRGSDVILGQDGNDVLVGNAGFANPQGDGDDYVDGGAGDDELWGGGGSDVLLGGDGDDVLIGEGNGVLSADDGMDVLDGGAGSDWLYGNGNDDILRGGTGDDNLYGEEGNDTLDGGVGFDYLEGGAGDDTYVNVTDDDTVFDIEGKNTIMLAASGGLGAGGLSVSVQTGSDGSQYMQLGVTLDDGSVLKLDSPFFANGTTTLQFAHGEEIDLETLVGASLATPLNLINSDEGGRVYGGAGNDLLTGGSGADTLAGHNGNDVLQGGDGNDILDGGAGNDSLVGGDGDDIFQGGAGRDTLQGNAGLDIYQFDLGGGSDIVIAQTPVDASANVLQLGQGIAQTDVEFVKLADGGLLVRITSTQDSLKFEGWFTNGAGVSVVRFADNSELTAAAISALAVEGFGGTALDDYIVGTAVSDRILGYGGNDTLDGGAGDDELLGGNGDDWLIGGTGNDIAYGGQGNDTYRLTKNFYGETTYREVDQVVEYANEGIDTLLTIWGGTLPDNVENMNLNDGSGSYATFSVSAIGNGLDNILVGRSTGVIGQDVLDGKAGADTMYASNGWQLVYVDNPGDRVIGQGYEIRSSIDYALLEPSGSWVPGFTNGMTNRLALIGSAAVNGTGNVLNNVLFGNLNTATNTLTGGLGDDIFIIGLNDSVVEAVSEGSDSVYVSLTAADFGREIRISDLGFNNIESYGLVGNADNVTLRGDAGDNELRVELSPFSRYRANLHGEGGNDRLIGGATGEVLDGGTGTDYMAGGSGNDVYIVDSAGDQVAENLSNFYNSANSWDYQPAFGWFSRDGGIDTVQSSITYTLGANLENLTLTGTPVIDGTGNALANVLRGNSASNILSGLDGDDTIYAGNGDHARGGNGNDTLISENTGTWSYLWGEAGDDVLVGGSSSGLFVGGVGNDTINGGLGMNFIWGDDQEFVAGGGVGGNDTIIGGNGYDYVMAGAGNDVVYGNDGDDSLAGNAGNDTLHGGAGNDSLIGGPGTDTLVGGIGNDTYSVDDLGDLVTENADEGTDTVQTTITRTLDANVENLTLMGTIAIDGTGNELNNILSGNSTNNTLTGGAGDDILYGGTNGGAPAGTSIGSLVIYARGTPVLDVYPTMQVYVDGVLIQEFTVDAASYTAYIVDPAKLGMAAGKVDVVFTNDAYRPDIGQDRNLYVQKIMVNGQTINATDNGVFYDPGSGMAAFDGLNLRLGQETMGSNGALRFTLGDNDTLDGGVGADQMSGGNGNDTYLVDNMSDVVTEIPNEGMDTVRGSISYILGANLENLVLTGTAAINGTGNTLNNLLMGNASNNILYGDAGADTLIGNAGNDRLDGGTGNDILQGGQGNDTYVVESAGDSVGENANQGWDTVESSISYTLGANVESLTLTGTAAINGTGNELGNTLTGNGANNVLTGGGGADYLEGGAGTDTMAGGMGDDTYVIDDLGDVVTENVGEGTYDSVELYLNASYTAGADIEYVYRYGSGNWTTTGNSADNYLYGNSGGDTLIGLSGNDLLWGDVGADTLIGGMGDDVYYVENAGDIVTEAAGEGVDKVYVFGSVAYTLAANVENGFRTFWAGSLTGNEFDNSLSGSWGVDTLDGGAGADTLSGFAGDDTLVGGLGNDTYSMGRGYSVDTVVENDTTAGNTDVAQFLSGISSDQIWFKQATNNLEVSIIGTSDKLVINDWYLGDAYHVEQFKTIDGAQTLLDSNVQNLVNAMASFAPPAAGQTTLPTNYQDALAGVIAANWQ